MATFTKLQLSSSFGGRNIPITSTSSLEPTNIHTCVSSSTVMDEVWLWASSTTGSSVSMSLFMGSTSSADIINCTISPNDVPFLIIPGFVMNNTSSIQAMAQSQNVININGFVNRIS